MHSFLRFVLPVFGLMGARLAGAAFGFLSQLLLARNFPAHDVGIVFLAMSVTIFASLVMTGGYHTLGLTYLARYYAFGRKRLIDAFLAASRQETLVVCTVILAVVVPSYWLAPAPTDLKGAVLFGCLAAVPLAVIRLNNSAANAQKRFALSYAPDFVYRPGLTLAFIGAMLLFGVRQVEVLLIAMVVLTAGVATGQGMLLGGDNAVPLKWTRPSHDLRRHFRGRAAAMLLVTLVVGASADLVVLLGGVFFAPSEVAVLGVAVRLAALVGFFAAASQQFVLRDLATAVSRAPQAEVSRLLLRTNVVSLSTIVLAIIAVAMFGHVVLGVFGPDYAVGYWPLMFFMAGQGFRILGGMNGHLLALGGHQIRSAALCLAAVLVLVVGAAVMSPIWGITGLAAATVVAEAFWAIGLAALTHRLEGRRGDIFAVLTQR